MKLNTHRVVPGGEMTGQYLRMGLFSIAVVWAGLLWQGRMGFQLSDEGSLWYGTQQVMKGDVPIRDFMSYDIGRYYWSAALMSLQGDNGIMALRYAVAVFQVLGLYSGLILVARTSVKPWSFPWFAMATAILVVWMYPRHKLFDASISIGLIALLTFLAERPKPSRYFLTGLGVGLAAVFGRNHGVYGAFGSIVEMIFLLSRSETVVSAPRAVGAWAGGVVVGYSPVLAMVVFCPGFGQAFWEGIRYVFEVKTTNLTLPIPWPWLITYRQLSVGDSIRSFFVGLFFIGTLIFGLIGLGRTIWSAWCKEAISPPVLGCLVLALPYAHYAYSRADIGHLALGIFPMLLGLMVWMSELSSKSFKWSAGGALCAASLLVMLPMHPGWQSRVGRQWSPILIGRETLYADQPTERDVAFLKILVTRFAPNPTERFLTVPSWPGAYALMDRPSPTWEIYPLLPRSELFQRTEILRIEKFPPSFVLINDYAQDGREELRFRNSHSILNSYLETHYKSAVNVVVPASNYHVLIRSFSGPQ